MKAQRLE